MLAFPPCHFIEKVNYISAELISDSSTFVEIKGTSRIYFQSAHLSQYAAELALELECSLPDLRHGESYNVIGHSVELKSEDYTEPLSTREALLRGGAMGLHPLPLL